MDFEINCFLSGTLFPSIRAIFFRVLRVKMETKLTSLGVSILNKSSFIGYSDERLGRSPLLERDTH